MPLLEWLSRKPEDLLLPNEAVWADASAGLKQSLDGLAKKYTSLGGLHVDGLKAEQVWIQAQMVMEGVADELGAELAELNPEESGSELGSAAASASDSDGSDERSRIAQAFSDSDSAVELDDESDESDEELAEREAELSAETAEQEPQADDDEDEDEDEEDGDEKDEDEAESDASVQDESDAEPTKRPTDAQDDFDLAEFQQHVLQLEQDPEDDSEEVDFGADLQGSSDEDADLHYNDFFAPPAKKSRQERPRKKVQFANDDADARAEAAAETPSDAEANMEDVVASTRKDLFESDDDEAAADAAAPSAQRLSKFEQQQRELARQIEELENENVGEKEWGMRGEIKAAERPQDSLIDADLEFERGSKPAPVNTQESTSTLEELIKERIRKQQFDDLPRRSELAEERAKRELPELPETKSQKSLAELYEEDHMRAENPEYYSKQDSAVLEAAHTQIKDMFTALSRKLDALCSWHYTPKAAAPSLSVVTDQPSIAMEDAQPGTLGAQSQLAPQEIYRGESATPMASAEMSASLKRHKRREKALRKTRAGAGAPAAPRDKDAMFSALKRGNVTLVDRRGEKRDMRGNAVKDKAPPKAANVKL